MALFDILPPDLFKPLAAPSRRFFADLLLLLHDRTFMIASDAPRRGDVMAEIAAYLPKWEAANGPVSEDNDTPAAMAAEDRARAIYQRLVDTGWLIEHKDRYIRLVDLDPDASGLLHVLASIERGDTRTYGGAVVGVLSSLESAAANPADRSENIRNALRGARDFMAHMRMVSVSLRKVEERIVRQETIQEIFRHFFEDFVQRHLIADYKTLHTKDNPFRFRSHIIHQAQTIIASSLTIFALGEAYCREGKAASPEKGQRLVVSELNEIMAIFEGTEGHLAAIDRTAQRIERRIMNTARYMDRVGRRSEARLIEAIRKIAVATEDDIGVKPALLPRNLPIGPAHIASPRRERPPVERASLRVAERDPAFEAFARAKADYVRRTRVTPQSVFSYLEKLMRGRDSLRASDIIITSVEDFVVFQRLREIQVMFDGAVARKFDIEFLDSRVRNEWIDCQDFIIRPKKAKASGVERNAA